MTGHRDLYFTTLLAAQTALKQAARGLRQSSHSRQLSFVLDAYMQEKVQRGSCSARSAQNQRARLRDWLVKYLEEDIGKLTPSAPPCSMSTWSTPLRERPVSRQRQPPLATF